MRKRQHLTAAMGWGRHWDVRRAAEHKDREVVRHDLSSEFISKWDKMFKITNCGEQEATFGKVVNLSKE